MHYSSNWGMAGEAAGEWEGMGVGGVWFQNMYFSLYIKLPVPFSTTEKDCLKKNSWGGGCFLVIISSPLFHWVPFPISIYDQQDITCALI